MSQYSFFFRAYPKLARMISNDSISPIEREDLKQDLLGMMSDANKIVNGEWGQCACNFGLLAINQTGFAKSI